MKKREPISTIMTKSVFTIQKTDNLEEAIALIQENHIRHLPVMHGDSIVGIISSTDLKRLTFGELFDNQKSTQQALMSMLSIEQVMASHPKTITSDTLIKDVAAIFAAAEFHALPVVDNNHVVGIVTTTDLIKYMLEQY